ncbi:MAG: hypothetical protein ACTSSN_11280, partial [Candidatus Heimdallarchaeaceae archaeon]
MGKLEILIPKKRVSFSKLETNRYPLGKAFSHNEKTYKGFYLVSFMEEYTLKMYEKGFEEEQ